MADGHSGRGKVCASTSSQAPAAASADWKSSDMVQSYQYLPIRQNDVAPIMSALAGVIYREMRTQNTDNHNQ